MKLRRLDSVDALAALHMFDSGLDTRDIAFKLGVPEASVYNAFASFDHPKGER